MNFLVVFLIVLPAINSFSLPNAQQFQLIVKEGSRLVRFFVPNKECATDLQALILHLGKFELWALKMLDAFSKVNSGVLEGNIHFIGSYDECLSIKPVIDGRTIQGQYCTALLKTYNVDMSNIKSYLDLQNLTYSERYLLDNMDALRKKGEQFADDGFIGKLLRNTSGTCGVCVPKTCSAQDLQLIVSYIEWFIKVPTGYNVPVSVEFDDVLCVHEGKQVVTTTLDHFVYFFFGFLALVLTMSTIYDIYLRKCGRNSNILVIFSVYTNARKLFSTDTIKAEERNIACLHGLKVLTCFWVILGHHYMISILLSKNLLYILAQWRLQLGSTFIQGAFYGVETAFTGTSCLATYLYLKRSEKSKITLGWFYVAKFYKIWPLLVATILIHTSILKYLWTGPFGPIVEELISESCRKVWWPTLLFSNNFFHWKTQCVPQSWFSAVDAQLYLFTPLILFYIKKHPKRVFGGMAALFLSVLVYNFTVSYINSSGFVSFDADDAYLLYLYMNPVARVPSWLIGIVLGYCYYYYSSVKISQWINIGLWFISLYVMLKLILNLVYFADGNDVFRSAVWNTFAKPVWCLAVSFIIFSCASGNGGLINAFLSSSVFRVLGRLAQCMYLSHVTVLLVLVVAIKRDTDYFDNFHLFCRFWGMLVSVLICSFIMYLAIEAPLGSLVQHLGKRRSKLEKAE